MCKLTIPEYLNSTVSMISKAFPYGLDKTKYFELLYLLYDYMSDENLSMAMALFTNKDVSIIANDIYKVYDMDIDRAKLKELQFFTGHPLLFYFKLTP